MPTVCGTNQVDSNITGLSFAEEECMKLLPGVNGADAVWYGCEPNSYPNFGATLKVTPRTPITATRQQKKGSVTDLDAQVAFQSDLTQTNLSRLMQGFFFADIRETGTTKPMNGAAIPVTAVTAADKTFTVAIAGILAGQIIKASGFGVPTNNGLFTAASDNAGALAVNEATADEAAPPAAAKLEVVGMQFAAGDVSATWAAGVFSLHSAAGAFGGLGSVIPGQWLFIGGDAAATHYDGFNGYGRVLTVTANQIVFDKTTFAPAADAGAGKTIQLFTGNVLRSESNPALIKRRTYQFERTLGQDAAGTQSQYGIGCIPNTFTLNFAQGALVTADLAYIACDDEQRTGTDGLKPGTRVSAPGEAAFNTTSDVYMMRLDVEDPANPNPQALFGFASDGKIEINNNIAANKAIGVLGAFDSSSGSFEVTGSITAYFTTVAATQAIRENADAGLYVILAKHNAGIIYDTPLLSLGGGAITVTKDKPITVPITSNAAMSQFGHTMLMQIFDYLPTLAMPL